MYKHLEHHEWYLQAMIPTMVACTIEMMVKWDAGHKTVVEIDVQEEFQMLTADIIAHTSFGSSYKEGKQVFEMQHEQQVFFQKDSSTVYIPGSRCETGMQTLHFYLFNIFLFYLIFRQLHLTLLLALDVFCIYQRNKKRFNPYILVLLWQISPND